MYKRQSIKNMKHIVVLFFLMFTTLTAYATPARPNFKKTLTLVDGKTIEARLVGNEYKHYWLGADGNAYTQQDGTELYKQISHEELNTMAQIRRGAPRKAIYASTSDGLGKYGQSGLGAVNSIGEYTIPVIMVEFSNKKFKNTTTIEKMNRFYNEEGYHDEAGCVGSVRDYFKSQSRGMFVPTFEIVGKVSLSKTYQTYGSGDEGVEEIINLTKDAVAAAVDQLGTDFSKYVRTTTNVNGTKTGVPLVCILYAGYGQATGSPTNSATDTVWPCEIDCNQTMSDTFFNSLFVGNELYSDDTLMGMGVFCHETGHALGLPDFYCTDYSYSYDDAFSDWSIMDTGCYVNDGRSPIGYTAYERSYLGWLDIPTYTPGSEQTLVPYTDETGTTAVKIATSNDTEYFIVENRQPGTWYPEDMGSGLLVSRFAYNQYSWSNDILNNTQSKKRAMMITANNESMYYSGNQANLFGNGVNSITSLTRYSSGTINPEINTITKNEDGTIILNKSEQEDPTEALPSLLYESLSKYTGANDGTATINNNNSDLDFNGWTSFSKVFKGGTSSAKKNGGCLKLGSGSSTGSMEASGIPLNGKGKLSFYLKKYSNDTGKLEVTVTGAEADVTTFTPSGSWTLCEVNITGAEGNVTIKLATSSKRAYLDEIKLEQTAIPVTITAPGYATLYYSNMNLVVPDDVTAYTYTVVNDILSESKTYTSGEIIPKGTAVVLMGNSGTYIFDVTTFEGEPDPDNMLRGFDTDNLTVGDVEGAEYKFYMVSCDKNGNNPGFYYGAKDGAAFTSIGHLAYLPVPTTVSQYVHAYYFSMNSIEEPLAENYGELEDITAIRSHELESNGNSAAFYDLQGRKVDTNSLKKGFYIKNGKKYVIK